MVEEKKFDIVGNYILVTYFVFLLRTIGAWSLLPSKIDSLLFGLVGLIGGVLLVWDFVQVLRKKRTFDFDILLVLFLIALTISIAVNYHYSPVGNIKVLAWQAVFFLLMFSSIKFGRVAKNFLDRFQGLLIGFGFTMSLVSLVMFFTRFSYRTPLEQKTNPLRIGFVENRLFGSYTDPNYAAVMSVIVMIFSVYYLMKPTIKNGLKAFLIVNLVLQLAYIALSGSRNGLVTLLFAASVGAFFYLFHKFQGTSIKKVLIGLVAGALLASVSFLAIAGVKEVFPKLPAISVSQKYNDNNSGLADENEDEDEVSLGREDIQGSGDVSNLRFTIWKSAMEIFKKNPVFGMPPKSLHQYAIQEMPTTYLAQTKLAVHNAYLFLLVSTGVVGTVIMLIFMVKNIVLAFIYAFKVPKMTKSFLYYLLTCGVLAVSGLFHNELFLMATSSAIVFWVCLAKMNQDMVNLGKVKK